MHGKWSSNGLKRVRRVLVVYVGIYLIFLIFGLCVYGWICGCHMPGYICLKVWVKEWCGFAPRIHMTVCVCMHRAAVLYNIMLCDCGVDCFRLFFFSLFFHLLFINMTIIYKNVLLDFYWSCLSSGRNGKFGSYFLLCIRWMTKRVVCGMLCIWYVADLIFSFLFLFREGFSVFWIIRWIELNKKAEERKCQTELWDSSSLNHKQPYVRRCVRITFRSVDWPLKLDNKKFHINKLTHIFCARFTWMLYDQL